MRSAPTQQLNPCLTQQAVAHLQMYCCHHPSHTLNLLMATCSPIQVRCTRRIKIAATVTEVLRLAQAPPFRAFRSVDRLCLRSDTAADEPDWAEFAAAVAAAVESWPQLEEVALVEILPDDYEDTYNGEER